MSKEKERKQVVPRVLLLAWECPECKRDVDLEADTIYSWYGRTDYSPLIEECEWCGHKVEINVDDIDI